jgi:hypothetical protein
LIEIARGKAEGGWPANSGSTPALPLPLIIEESG